MLTYFDVWEVDTVEATMRSYVEDQYGRIASDIGPWETVRFGLADLAQRMERNGFALCGAHRTAVDTYKRAYRGKL